MSKMMKMMMHQEKSDEMMGGMKGMQAECRNNILRFKISLRNFKP
jgi:hypothetical protein